MISNFSMQSLILLLLVGVAVPWTADAQAQVSRAAPGSMEGRVINLERISDAQAQLLQQLQQQFSDSQRDIDALRGQIQQNTYQLNKIVEKQQQMYQHIDSLKTASQAVIRPPDVNNTATAAATNSHSSTTATQSGNANTDYKTAVSLVLEKKQFDQAIIAFQSFVKKYPASTYQPNANYWLGQLNYNKGKKDDAAYYFAKVVKNYPESAKSQEALYKVGIIMQEKGDNAKAKAVFQQVVKLYPGSNFAGQAQKRIGNL